MPLWIRLLIVFTLLFWVAGIFLEWIIPLVPNSVLALPILQNAYSHVCHQQSHKLLGESVYHSLVCARCSGIYLGFFLVSIISLIWKLPSEPRVKYFLFAMLPMVADVFLYSIGIYSYSKILALFTGLLLGSTGFLYFYSALNKLFQEIKQKKK
ncbi:MAG: DUF2085 domain-containing protein [Melioribacteraceae bacterium]